MTMNDTTIGIDLADLGIESEDDFTDAAPYDYSEFPKAFDFSLALFIYGSWRQLRDSLSEAATNRYDRRPPLHFTMYWAETENETEDSIKASLTGLRYDAPVHEEFKWYLQDWAQFQEDPDCLRQALATVSPHQELVREYVAMNLNAPRDVLLELVKDRRLSQLLLTNSALEPQMVRDLFALVSDDVNGVLAVVASGADLPQDVIEALVKIAGADLLSADDCYLYSRLARRPELTEQVLIDLIGKCDEGQILMHPACTDRVQKELDSVRVSGGTLMPPERSQAVAALKRTSSAIKTGTTAAIRRQRNAQSTLLAAVIADPDLSIYEAHQILMEDDF